MRALIPKLEMLPRNVHSNPIRPLTVGRERRDEILHGWGMERRGEGRVEREVPAATRTLSRLLHTCDEFVACFQVDGIVHLAGQIGLVPGTMQLVEGGAEAEARLALRHAFRALEAVGTSAKRMVQVSERIEKRAHQIHLRNSASFPLMPHILKLLGQERLQRLPFLASVSGAQPKDNRHVTSVREGGRARGIIACAPLARPYRITYLVPAPLSLSTSVAAISLFC